MKPFLTIICLVGLAWFTFNTGKFYSEEQTKAGVQRTIAGYQSKLNLKDNEILALENEKILLDHARKHKPRYSASVFLLNGTDDLYFAQTPRKAEAFKRVNAGAISAIWNCWK